MKRLSKDDYYLGIADAVSKRATCIRRVYGAVIVKSDVIVGTGYCGSPRGQSNCCDHGKCLREERGAKPGEHYEWCVSVHAEQNAIIPTDSEKLQGAIIYVFGRDAKTGSPVNSIPCEMCLRVIKNAQIKEIVYFNGGKIERIGLQNG
jgi:dCMP deaminase